MGSWGITERESDYGLDLLGAIVAKQLKAVDFATFNVAEGLLSILKHMGGLSDVMGVISGTGEKKRLSKHLCNRS